MAERNNENVRYYLFNGNVKVGNMYTWNKLAGNTTFKGCAGSCGNHCPGCWNAEDWKHSPCYAAKSYIQYGDHTLDPHIKNTNGIRNNIDEVFEQLDDQLTRARNTKPCRIHSTGELETVEELKKWLELARKHTERNFYVYTKAFEIVDKILTENPKAIPSNFFINISIWHNSGIECYNKWKHIKGIRAFVYDDGYDYKSEGLELKSYCPAYRKNEKGKVKLYHDLTCDKCGLCFKNTNKVIACLNH